jgi:hypothetical protein
MLNILNMRSKNIFMLLVLSLALFVIHACTNTAAKNAEMNKNKQFKLVKRDSLNSYPKTIFQASRPWGATYDNRADAVMVYGYSNSLKSRIKSWKKHGYITQFMTGMAWGNYQEYFKGDFDGKEHLDEGQVDYNGNRVQHGKYVPYVVPTQSYLTYFKTVIRKVIDSGINTIYLEEPEFWAKSGYSKAFKKEWKRYYGTAWKSETKSANAAYMSSELKHYLYVRALREVFSYAKAYGKSIGRDIKCFVATHSLVNYSAWRIVSPEASINNITSVDGIIGQVWTGTSRTPIYYNGKRKTRTFENAYLEYGSVESMVGATGRVIYFETDPLADNPHHSWENYKKNYEATFIAQLLYPKVDHYEVMPWPNRIYNGKHRLNKNSTAKTTFPYATQLQIMINALKHMSKSSNHVSGSQGIGVLMSNSMLYQRTPVVGKNEDPALSNFYGMALPLLKQGIPVKLKIAENLKYPRYLKNTKLLIMTYSDMKPLSPKVDKYIATWVKQGGVLMYYGRDDDVYQHVNEWWDNGKYHYKTPSQDLFHRMNLHVDSSQTKYSFGIGTIYIIRKDPKELVMQKHGDRQFIAFVKKAYKTKTGKKLKIKNSFYIKRGPYYIGAVMNESETKDTTSLRIKGPVIDLFNPDLPVLNEKIVKPGQETFLYDLKNVNHQQPKILCSAAGISNVKKGPSSYIFTAKGPLNTQNAMRILLPSKPSKVLVKDTNGKKETDEHSSWDASTNTLLLRFANSPQSKQVSLHW